MLLDARDNLEKTTSAVVNFPACNSCSIQGGALAVTMAKSVIEERLKPSHSTSQPNVIEPQLRDFALKLGYSNHVIDQAVQKLGCNVTQNTLLDELLKTTASLPYQISAGSSQPKPSSSSLAAYPRREVVSRGPSSTPTSMPRYDGASEQMVRSPVHQNWEREPSPGPVPHYALRDPAQKSTIPRTGYEMPGDLMEWGIHRGTKRGYEQRPTDIVARGAPSTSAKPLMQVHAPHYANQVSPVYDISGDGACNNGISASDRIDEQEQLMYQQIVGAKKAAANTSSNLRPVVIDGSNVAMR